MAGITEFSRVARVQVFLRVFQYEILDFFVLTCLCIEALNTW